MSILDDTLDSAAKDMAKAFKTAFKEAYITGWGHASEAKGYEADMYRMDADKLRANNAKLIEFASAMYRSILLVPDDHIPAETKARYFETAVSLGLDVPDD